MSYDFMTYDPQNKVVTIDGLKFARELFEMLATSAIGSVVQIVKRENGVITLRQAPKYLAIEGQLSAKQCEELKQWWKDGGAARFETRPTPTAVEDSS